MDFKQLLRNAYHDRTKSLKEREAEILTVFRNVDPNKRRREEAKVRVLNRQCEEVLAKGDFDREARYKTEIVEIEHQWKKEEGESEGLNNELEQIRVEIERAGQEVVKAVFPKIREFVVGRWEEALNTCEAAWESLQEFEREGETKLTASVHRNPLSPTNYKSLREKTEKWVEWGHLSLPRD